MIDCGMLLVEKVRELNPELESDVIVKYITLNQERLIKYVLVHMSVLDASVRVAITKDILGLEKCTIWHSYDTVPFRDNLAMLLTYAISASGDVMEDFAYDSAPSVIKWLYEYKIYNLSKLEKMFEKGFPSRQVRDIYDLLITKYNVDNKFPHIIGDDICISSRSPILVYNKAGRLAMVFVDITTRSTATYEEIKNDMHIAKGMADARAKTVKAVKDAEKAGKLHYAQYAIGEGHIRISYNIDK